MILPLVILPLLTLLPLLALLALLLLLLHLLRHLHLRHLRHLPRRHLQLLHLLHLPRRQPAQPRPQPREPQALRGLIGRCCGRAAEHAQRGGIDAAVPAPAAAAAGVRAETPACAVHADVHPPASAAAAAGTVIRWRRGCGRGRRAAALRLL